MYSTVKHFDKDTNTYSVTESKAYAAKAAREAAMTAEERKAMERFAYILDCIEDAYEKGMCLEQNINQIAKEHSDITAAEVARILTGYWDEDELDYIAAKYYDNTAACISDRRKARLAGKGYFSPAQLDRLFIRMTKYAAQDGLIETLPEVIEQDAAESIARVEANDELTDAQKDDYKARKSAKTAQNKIVAHAVMIDYARRFYETKRNYSDKWMFTPEKVAEIVSTEVRERQLSGRLYVLATYDEVMRVLTGHLTDLDLDVIIDDLYDGVHPLTEADKKWIVGECRYTPAQADQIVAYFPTYMMRKQG